jgi:hypothetical protein
MENHGKNMREDSVKFSVSIVQLIKENFPIAAVVLVSLG